MDASTLRYVRDRAVAEEYDAFNFGNELFDFDTALLDRFMPKPGRLIDLGCGAGRHVLHFARRGFDVTGLDLSEHMLAIASEKIRQAGLTAEFIHCDMRDLSDLQDGRYDYATCMFSTLGMVRGSAVRRGIVEQVHRMLKPGGRFSVHAHNRWHRWYSIDGMAWLIHNAAASLFTSDEIGDLWMESYRGIPNMYLHIFSVREMRELLGDSGFTDVEIICLNEPRNAELRDGWFRGVRANGFIGIGMKGNVEGDLRERAEKNIAEGS